MSATGDEPEETVQRMEAIQGRHPVAMRRRLSDADRARIAAGADIMVTTELWGNPLQPIKLQVVDPTEAPVFV